MAGIACGGFRVDVDGRVGNRLLRRTLSRTPTALPRRPDPVQPPDQLFGRAAELEHIRDALDRREPVEFHAPCGFGASSLLRYVAAAAPGVGLPGPYALLRVGGQGLDDLMARLVSALFVSEPDVKLTSAECAQLLGQASGVVVLDDVLLDPGEVDYLRSVMPGCGLLLAAPRPVLQRGGMSRALAGLPEPAAVELVSRELGRPLADHELSAVHELWAAVDGEPLRLRLAAALVREESRSFAALADEVRLGGPDALEHRSLAVLPPTGRRVLAVLAMAAGARLTPILVETMAAVHDVHDALRDLHRRGLAEVEDDRFGLPVCKRDSYRQNLLGDIEVGGALRSLGGWLASSDPWNQDVLLGADGVLAILGFAAERKDWKTVVRLARLLEPVLLIARRWEACSHVLELGQRAASQLGDVATQAYLTHQHGTLAAAREHREEARQSLEQALVMRQRLGDTAGAEVTRSNLALLGAVPAVGSPPPEAPRASRSMRRGRIVAAVTAVLAVLALVVFLADVFAGGSAGPTSGSAGAPMPTFAAESTSPAGSTTGSAEETTGSTMPPRSSTPTTEPEPIRAPGASPAQLAFNPVNITPGIPPSEQSVTVTNQNNRPITITSVATDDQQFSAGAGCRGELAASESCTVTLTFQPTFLGQQSGQLVVETEGAEATAVALGGTGYVQLTVTITGSGTVIDDKGQIDCPEICTAEVEQPEDANLTLTATPDTNRYFVGWGGECSNSGTPPNTACELILTADARVNATFNTNVD
jgi:Transmembrane protein 131-like N-terminal/Divergent InlB B-repeat domain